ncbi:TPA: hypothetical protein ACHKWG_003716 [Escherichia coli]|nr:hypothetical protein [Escherichia coli]
MTALSFRQVRDNFRFPTDTDFLSHLAEVPLVVGMYIHPWGIFGLGPGERVRLSLDGDRYISEVIGQPQVRVWVTLESFRYGWNDPTTSPQFAETDWGGWGRKGNGPRDAYVWMKADPPAPPRETTCNRPDVFFVDSSTPPPSAVLIAEGVFRVHNVELKDDSVTLGLVPHDESLSYSWCMPFYLNVPLDGGRLPTAVSSALFLWSDFEGVLEELAHIPISDANQPPAKGNTMSAETDTVRSDGMFCEGTGLPKMRRTLAMLVGYVTGQVATGAVREEVVAQLPDIYDGLKPGGVFRGVIDEWLRALPEEMQANAARITGVSTKRWEAYDKAPDSKDGIMCMLWLCLAYLTGLPEVHAAGKKPARNERSAYRRVENKHKKSGNFWAGATDSAVGDWFDDWFKKRPEQGEVDGPKTERPDK